LIPILVFWIIGTKHKNNYISIRIKSLLPLWFIHIGKIACCLYCATTESQIYNFKFCIWKIHCQNIFQNIWICFAISGTFPKSNRIPNTNNLCFIRKRTSENSNQKGNKFFEVYSSISIFANLFEIQSIFICPITSSSSLSGFSFLKWDKPILVGISLYKLWFECL